MASETARPPKLRWVLTCGLIILLNTLNFGLRSGQCVDYVSAAETASNCSFGPMLGWPGSVLLAIVSVALVAYGVRRLLRASRSAESPGRS